MLYGADDDDDDNDDNDNDDDDFPLTLLSKYRLVCLEMY